MMPKSSAPRLSRLALTPPATMPEKVNSIASGITSAVKSAARRFPRKKNSTAMTRIAPSIRFLRTVAIAFSTSTVRSYTVTALHALGQAAVDLEHARIDRLRHLAAVLADQHDDGAQHHLDAVLGGRAGAQFAPDAHFGDVAHPHRNAIDAGDDDIADVVDRRGLARRAHQVLLAFALDVAGADIAVVALERAHDVDQFQPVRRQRRRVRGHQVFLVEAADGVDVGDARHRAQLRLDDPVLDLAQVGRRVGRAIRLLRPRLALDGPLVDFTQARGDRPHRRHHAGRQVLARVLQALADELAREVDVGALVEHHRHLRQAVARQRAVGFQVRQAGQHRFDRVGDALLDLERRVARRGRVDLHLDVGHVGHGVDRQAADSCRCRWRPSPARPAARASAARY